MDQEERGTSSSDEKVWVVTITKPTLRKKAEDIGPYIEVLFDLVDSIKGVNVDAMASAIDNILDAVLDDSFSGHYKNELLEKLVDELQLHIGG